MLHDWHIDPAQYTRHENRRGRRHAYERLDPGRTALVVVDMVPFFLDENPYARGIVPQINTLAAALRAAGGTVAWVLPASGAPGTWQDEFYGQHVAQSYAGSGGGGTPRERLWPGLDAIDGDDPSGGAPPGPSDLFVEKSSASAFFPGRCDLADRLGERSIDTVLVAGTVANVCCESTVRDAATLGHRVIMVADADASIDDATLNATLHTVYRSFGDVRPTDEVLGLIAAATP